MKKNKKLPKKLIQEINNEQTDFIIISKQKSPFRLNFKLIFLGTTFLLVSVISFTMNFINFVLGKDITIIVDNIELVANLNNLEPLKYIIEFHLVFLITGLFFTAPLLLKFYLGDQYFVATPTRLIHYYINDIVSTPWKNISPDIVVHNVSKAIFFHFKKAINNTKFIRVCDINDMAKIKKISMQRIRENSK